jgi:diguanylate cyclase
MGLHVRGTPVTITVSAGLTELRAGDTAAAALERADRALYRAKHEGRDRCVVG